MTRKRANVTQADVGSLYLYNGRVYRLTECATEPTATMLPIAGNEELLVKPISEFADFVRLKPERPIPKPPVPRKTRSDKGTHREKHTEEAP